MFCEADCMVLHSWRSSDVPQDYNLGGAALLEVGLLLGLIIFKDGWFVLVRVVLAW